MIPPRALAALLCCLALAFPSCNGECERPPDRSAAEATISTFHRAMRCDDREDEYACFSERLKASFGTMAGYSIIRAIVREQNPLALVLIDHASLDGRVRIEPTGDPNRVRARIDVGNAEAFELELVNEPEYRIRHTDGKISAGYARRIEVDAKGGRDAQGFDIHVDDPQLFLESKRPAAQVELRERWVIDGFPGLESAIEAASARQPGRD